MHCPRLAPSAFVGLVVLASCLGGPPAAPVSATLGPGTSGAAPRVQAPFAVVFAGPRGTVRDLREPAITVLFNRAAHDAETAETAGAPAIRVLSGDGAAIGGAWRWVGSHGLVFAPDRRLPGSTAFSVVVPAGTSALDGARLPTDYRFDFATTRPEVARALPEDGATNIRPSTIFGIVFNQAMDPGVVAAAARIVVRPQDGRAAAPGAPRSIAFHAAHPASGPDAVSTVLLRPDAPLPLDTAIDVVLAKGLHGEGPLGTSDARTLSFRTYGPIRIVDVRCPRATGPRCQAHRDLTVVLSSPIDPAEFRAHLKAPRVPRAAPVRTAPPTDPKARPAAPLPSIEQRLAADPDYGQRYHLTVTAGLRDVFGQTLDHDLSIDVDTEAPFIVAGRPVANPRPAASAATDDTASESSDDSATATSSEPAPPSADDPRPHRARLTYDVAIGLQGHVIEALAAQGVKSHKVPIGATNIPSYAMTASRVREDEALAWLDRAARANGGDTPPWRWTWVNPGVPENVRSVRDVDLDALLGGAGSRGAALLAVALPGNMGEPKSELVTVTDLAVSAKMSRYGGLVWVTRLSSGAPVEGAEISIRKPHTPELYATRTDASGLATVPADRYTPVDEHGSVDRDACVFVHKDSDWTYQRLERAAASYRSSVSVDLAQRGEWAGMLYTDRGVYRPGEAIKLAGVFRRVDAAGIKASPGEAVRVAVTDESGESIFDGRAALDAFGEILLEVPVPKTAHLGSARIVAALGRKDGESFDHEVLFAAYKASEFKVGVDADKADYVRGDEARFDVHAEYLFGAPMGKAALHNYVSRTRAAFKPPHSEAFVTDDEAGALDHPEANPNAEDLRVEDGVLDEDGRAFAKLDLALPRMVGPEEVTFTTEVEDLTHQTVAHRAVVRVHPAAFYVGLQRPSSRFLAVGAPVPVGVAAFDPAGRRVADVRAKVELVVRTWTSVAIDESAAVPQRRSKVVDTVVATCDVTTAPGGASSCPLNVTQPGYYLLRARARDKGGNDVGSSSSFYCVDDRSDAPATAVAWSDPAGRGVQLETDKKQYEIGDVARVLVRSPFKKADALVTVERAGVLWRRVVTLEGSTPVVDVPIAPEYFPNAFVAVHLVRGRVQAPPSSGADLGAPDFRLGMAPIAVDPESHRLAVQVVTDRKEYRPGDEVTADVSVLDKDGRAPRAAVTFYAVDEGVLMLTAYATPDPLPPFTADRSLGVFEVESREALARLLPMKNGERVKPLGYEFLETPTGDDKGRDGGGGGGAMRADFKTTAYFEAGRVTSAEGRARYRFKLPDNLTTFRLMAIVASDDRFGKGEATVTTSRRLMARPALPRIVRVGDAFQAGVVVSSRDLGATDATVTLAAKGVTPGGPATQRVHVPSGGSVEVRFPVKAEVPGKATFELAVAGAGEQDRVRVDREVTLPVDLETAAVYGETTAASAVALGDLRRIRRDQGGLEVHLASTALVGLKTSFDRALDYPYGCTEQLTSRVLPLLLLPDMARLFGARMPAKIDDVVDDAIGALLTHQDDSGGFAFWEDGEAVPWLSAYAMLAIEEAANKGFFVPKAARDRGVEYLRQVLDQTSIGDADEHPDPNADDDVPLAPGAATDAARTKPAKAYATLAFIADVLATIGQPDPGYLNRLFDARAGRPTFAQALLLHSMVTAHMPAAETDALAKELVSRVRVDAGSAFVDESETLEDDLLDSSSRTTALVLRALIAAQPAHPLASRLARGLLDHRVGGAWRSTQENVWALLALDDYRRAAESAGPSFEARVFLGDDVIGRASFVGRSVVDVPLSIAPERLADPGDRPLTFEVQGQGKLFYSAELTYATTALPDKPADEGLFVQKRMRALLPEQLAAAQAVLPRRSDTSALVGEFVLVDLLLESPEPREQVVIDDPLPAGLEPIDFALDTAASNVMVDAQNPSELHRERDYGAFRAAVGMHRELHDDRVLTFLPHVDPGLYHFRYLARATTPGDFIVPPSRAECMYSPEVRGRTAATRFSVVPAPPKAPGQRPPS
jgi:alpha-2-macroglobulin